MRIYTRDTFSLDLAFCHVACFCDHVNGCLYNIFVQFNLSTSVQ